MTDLKQIAEIIQNHTGRGLFHCEAAASEIDALYRKVCVWNEWGDDWGVKKLFYPSCSMTNYIPHDWLMTHFNRIKVFRYCPFCGGKIEVKE